MKKYTLKTPAPKDFKIDYQKELNAEQYEVVTKAEGASLVLAGAGSGKTRTLVYRVAYLIEKGIDPKNILLVTFTNKAAREMMERVESLLGYPPKGLWGGTFHHIANIILHKYGKAIGIPNNFTIMDEDDARTLLKNIAKEHKVDKAYFPKPRVLKSILSYCVNSQTPIEEYLEKRYSRFSPEIVAAVEKIGKEYQRRKIASGNMDFDDLLLYWLRLLEEDQGVRERLAGQFQYILVDEYQDTNRIQARIMGLLSQAHGNILVVGDDAQSIYSFRAAEVSNILDFPAQHKGAQTFKLTRNYRSRPEILSLAAHSINQNSNQFKKDLQAHLKPLGQKPAYVPLRDSKEQANFIAQRVLELRDKGVELPQMAVLFRAAYQSLELELELNRKGIPYVMRGGLRFFEQAHVKDVVSFLKIYANPSDEMSWQRALTMQEGVGPKGASQIFENVKKCKDITDLLSRGTEFCAPTQRGSQGLSRVLGMLQKMHEKKEEGLEGMIEALLENGYERFVEKAYENPADRIEDLRQMARFAGTKKIEDFLAEVMLSQGFKGEVRQGTEEEEERLVLSTIHQAKGLEWHAVFMIGLVHGQFPHYKVIENPGEIEEERRLFYVASTRAKEQLYLTSFTFQYSPQTGSHIQRPSQFIEELDPGLVENWKVQTEDESFDIDEEEDEGGGGILDRVARSRKKKKRGGSEVEYIYDV